jgi:hypothetical protein
MFANGSTAIAFALGFATSVAKATGGAVTVEPS